MRDEKDHSPKERLPQRELPPERGIVLDYSEIENVSVADIDTKDAPDFSDAFIETATYEGRDMTEAELEVLNEDRDYVYEQVIKKLY